MTCLENHKNCNAVCCRGFFLPIGTPRKQNSFFVGKISADMMRYYELHEGIKIKDGWLFTEQEVTENLEIGLIEFKNKCKMLMPNCQCKIYRRNRPLICVTAYNDLKEGVFFPPNCIYSRV